MKMTESQKVAAAAWRIRRYALQMGEVQGQGYIGQALGYADVLATAFSHAMTYRPEDPEWEGRDRFLLSHGHYAIAYYAALLEAGIIPEAELETYGSDDSRLPMSGMATYTPGMEMSGGSLGQGLSIAVGMALGLRQKQSKAWVYNSMSDGELDEGSTWEAAMSAASSISSPVSLRREKYRPRFPQPLAAIASALSTSTIRAAQRTVSTMRWVCRRMIWGTIRTVTAIPPSMTSTVRPIMSRLGSASAIGAMSI